MVKAQAVRGGVLPCRGGTSLRCVALLYLVQIMAKDYAKAFYKTKAWKNCRAAYMASVGGLCERCYRNGLIVPGDIVHHKIHLTPENIKDPTVALNWKNLECLCRLCHNDEHKGDFLDGRTDLIQKRYRIDEFGRVII